MITEKRKVHFFVLFCSFDTNAKRSKGHLLNLGRLVVYLASHQIDAKRCTLPFSFLFFSFHLPAECSRQHGAGTAVPGFVGWAGNAAPS